MIFILAELSTEWSWTYFYLNWTLTFNLFELSTEWLLSLLNFLLNDLNLAELSIEKSSWNLYWMTFILAGLSTEYLLT